MEFKTSQPLTFTFWNELSVLQTSSSFRLFIMFSKLQQTFPYQYLDALEEAEHFRLDYYHTINSIVDWQLYKLNEICPCWNGARIEDFLSTFFLNYIPRCSDITIALIPTFVLVLEVSRVLVLAAFGASRLFLGTNTARNSLPLRISTIFCPCRVILDPRSFGIGHIEYTSRCE